MEFFAHSENQLGRRHSLEAHLRETASRAAKFASPFGGEELARLAGLWHDLGKFHSDFQQYLRDPQAPHGPDHSSAGAVLAASAVQLLSFTIGGHHAGLPSREELKCRLERKSIDPRIAEATTAAFLAMPELEPQDQVVLPEWLHEGGEGTGDRDHPAHRLDLFIRMLFSALVDADFLDTEAHFDSEKAERRTIELEIADLWDRMDAHHKRLLEAPATELNRMRNEIYESCVSAGNQSPGFFRLTVPTGGGKTLSSMAFALRHMLCHDLDRVIVAIPYTSIIEQTADVYREVFEGAVLEHHSSVDGSEDADPVTYKHQWSRLAAENWDAPIIVTTTVQLFESLFASRSGRCRKLHNLAKSVLILDEVQTLPAEILEPILDVLRELAARYAVSVVFCTATQPALAEGPYAKVLNDARHIVSSPERYFSALRRVTYDMPAVSGAWAWERVASEMRAVPQCLTVVNTKADALALLNALDDPEALYLSTSLCGAHRRQVLGRVRNLLAQNRACRLVSTQVVEAGVDLDFPLVLRAVGPLDRIVQAAGRANREGKLGREGGRVVVFDPQEGKAPPGVYRTALDTARAFLARGCDLHNPLEYAEFFRALYQAVDLDREGIQDLRAALDFPKVATRFRLIRDDSIAVVVHYPPGLTDVERLLGLARRQSGTPRWLFRALQPYVVGLRRRAAEKCLRVGLLEPVVDGLFHWLGPYDAVRGLDASAGMNPTDLIV